LTAQHDPTRCCESCAWALELDSLDAASHGQAIACGWTGPTPPLPEWLTHSEDAPDGAMAITETFEVAAWAIRPRTAGSTCPAWESLLQVDLELDGEAEFEPDPAFLARTATVKYFLTVASWSSSPSS